MDHSLPPHLAERFRWLVGPEQTTHGAGEFVLYWMHNAIRAHENPALDVAICLARQNGLPLLVYHGLSEDYPYASDRFHAFILQGQRVVQRELRDRGIEAHFHLQRDGCRGPHLKSLTRRAAVLVTEEMPVQPLVGWLERLSIRTTTPIAMVDASCIVPVSLLKRPYTRAFEFRSATKALYEQRIDRLYPEQPIDVVMFGDAIPFESLDLQDSCLSSLIAGCRIDHSIAPVVDTPGGSRAGYARWDRFKQSGLASYDQRRNDAASHDGPSRMSAYLHFGMVSPLRIAREASELARDQPAAKKFLDELLIWRELAFHFCFHNADIIDTLDALPDWSRKTLDAHCRDERSKNCSWETLARARTDQPLWDACQRSLLKHGELHNNLRMTWGKAFLNWARTPGRAFHLTLDLNHRYALDGRDPSSYGGVLWCFGQFDRPFEPESEIFGNVRTRSIEQHQSRIDLPKFGRIVDRPIATNPPTVAIIGAGIGGLIAARTLKDHGLDVTVFDKSRGVGGRMATKRSRASDISLSFDHGAQYFTARDHRFCRYVDSWIHDAVVQPWVGRIVELGSGGNVIQEKSATPRYVGVPGMNQVAKHMAKDLTLRLETTISAVRRASDSTWSLIDNEGKWQGDFDSVIFNCPPIQSAAILNGQSSIAEQFASAQMSPTWAVMLSAAGLRGLEFDGAFINEGPLSWIAREASKPGRPTMADSENWVLHASTDWSKANIERSGEEVTTDLLKAFESSTGHPLGTVGYAVAHRWRYAIPSTPLANDCLWDSDKLIGACGDWCGGPRIEGAFLSGMAVAGSLLRQLTIDRAPVISSKSS